MQTFIEYVLRSALGIYLPTDSGSQLLTKIAFRHSAFAAAGNRAITAEICSLVFPFSFRWRNLQSSPYWHLYGTPFVELALSCPPMKPTQAFVAALLPIMDVCDLISDFALVTFVVIFALLMFSPARS